MEIPVEKEALFAPKKQEKVEECNWCNAQVYAYENHIMSRCQGLCKRAKRKKREEKGITCAIFTSAYRCESSHRLSKRQPGK